jgi:hypothetical protein
MCQVTEPEVIKMNTTRRGVAIVLLWLGYFVVLYATMLLQMAAGFGDGAGSGRFNWSGDLARILEFPLLSLYSMAPGVYPAAPLVAAANGLIWAFSVYCLGLFLGRALSRRSRSSETSSQGSRRQS